MRKVRNPLKDIDYATAVARVRVNENYLLDTSDIDRLVSAKSEEEAMAVLQEKGFLSAGETIENALSSVVSKAFSLIKEIAPDKNEFDFLLIKNDFHNLKTVLKGVITDTNYEEYLIKPSVIDIETIKTAVKEQKFSILPKYMRDVALEAYNYFVTTSDGQLSDICIDKGSLEAVLALSKDNQNEFMSAPDDQAADLLSDPLHKLIADGLRESFRLNGLLVDDPETVEEIAGDFSEKSDVVDSVKRLKNGKISGSALISEVDFEGLQKDVAEKLEEICRSLLKGEIGITPMQIKDKTACDYCANRSICRFDTAFKGCSYRKI